MEDKNIITFPLSYRIFTRLDDTAFVVYNSSSHKVLRTDGNRMHEGREIGAFTLGLLELGWKVKEDGKWQRT